MTFYQIPKKESIRWEYVRLLRNDNLKLESDAHAFALGLKRKNNRSKYKQYSQIIMD